MSSIFTVPLSFDFTAADTDMDLFYLKPAADKPIRLRGFRISQSSEVGDAQEENLRITIIHLAATVTVGSGGSAVTPVDVDRRVNATAGFTARMHDTTLATSSGASTTLEEMGWNERNTPFEVRWLDEREMPQCSNAAALVVRVQTTAGDTLTVQGTAWVEEMP